MDKSEMIKALEARKLGERTRVLFDLLMESIGADYEVKQREVFDLIRARIEGEEEAISFFANNKANIPEMPVLEGFEGDD